MNVNSVVKEIRAQLMEKANPQVAQRMKKQFKGEIWSYGIRLPEVKKLAREYYRKFKSANDIQKAFTVAERLLASANMEEGVLALEMLRGFHRVYTPKLFSIFDQWVNYLTNWSQTDSLCCHHIAVTVEQDGRLINRLLKWTKSRNRWRRRAAAVSLVEPANKGMYLGETLKVAERLMGDKDEVVQKGVGWLLREMSVRYPNEIVAFLVKWKGGTSNMVLRTATEKLAPEKRAKISRGA
jgi:3-methyladenine DNA glycosylase AlkD